MAGIDKMLFPAVVGAILPQAPGPGCNVIAKDSRLAVD